jgi:hypothetical protein
MGESWRTVNASVTRLRKLLPKYRRMGTQAQQGLVVRAEALLDEADRFLLAGTRTDEAEAKLNEATI